MERIVWLIIMIPLSVFFTGIGIFAWKREKPMWFWSGSEVSEREISDVPAYNRANGIMWIVYSLIFWVSTVLGLFQVGAAGLVVGIGSVAGLPFLIIAYNRIYNRYKK
ncbi:MAG: hypothetical protein K5756_04605 [Clostridiales bacterium]|nr:hypothetical protein [Clostridiales bacterium]